MRIQADYASHRTTARDPHVLGEVIAGQGYRLPGASGPAETESEDQRAARDAEKDEFAARVQAILARLTPQQREVTTLRRLRGMTGPETAAELGITHSAVKSSLAHAKVNLHRELADLLDQRPRH